MARRLPAALLLASLATALLAPGAALAHGGNPDFRSVFHRLDPALPGVHVQVIGYDAYYEVRSTAREPVTIYGYEGEPYSRILPGGTVQDNVNSPAVYLNQDFYGTTSIPAHARAGAPVVWRTVDKTGAITWHDHRMHWLAKGRPPQVADEHARTKVFDYRIPISEGSTRSAIEGTLFWVGPAGGGFPVGAAIALAALVAGSLALVLVVRRRRAAAEPAAAMARAAAEAGGGRPEREAW
jgi:hypothetical protein